MKIAILSDIHGNMPALEVVLSEIGEMPIYCAGDLVGYGAYPNEVIEALWSRNATCIMGNHDQSVIFEDFHFGNTTTDQSWDWTINNLKPKNMTFLSSLKERHYEESLLMVHASPRNTLHEYLLNLEFVLEEIAIEVKQDIIITGHTHIPVNRRFNDKLFLNPGSVGQPRDGNPDASYAILNTKTEKAKLKRTEYDIEKAAEAIREIKEIDKRLRDRLSDRLYLGE